MGFQFVDGICESLANRRFSVDYRSFEVPIVHCAAFWAVVKQSVSDRIRS